MTDNDIIRALECCSNANDCGKCEYEPTEHKIGSVGCSNELMTDALDLIKRLQAENSNLTSDLTSLQRKLTSANAEIEKLLKHNEYILMQHAFQRRPDGSCWNDVIEKAKSEARKEFAERLYQISKWLPLTVMQQPFVTINDIDNLLEEMEKEE